MKLDELGTCDMPGCKDDAKWVSSSELHDVWHLCDCCQESMLGAAFALSAAGIPEPDEVMWAIELSRTAIKRVSK
jgi:hypothetical protein